MSSIAVIGPGAIGGTLAGWLARVPRHQLTVCARTPFETLELEIPGGEKLTATPRVLTNPNDATPVDWVIAVTKTYDTPSAARWLAKLVGPETRVAVVQNGVEHLSRFAGIVPADRVLPVIIDIPADRSGPGKIRQRRNGDITAPRGELGVEFAALFEGTTLAPQLSDDFTTAIWRKLALNSAGAIQAVARQPAGIVKNPAIAKLMHDLAAEAVLVGRAVGAKLADSLPDEVLERLRASPVDQVNSMLADVLAKRPLEVDARNGIIVRLGKEHGIPTPLNEMAVALLSL